MRWLAVLSIGLVLLPGCSQEPRPARMKKKSRPMVAAPKPTKPVQAGIWGGEEVALQVNDTGAVFKDLAGCFEGHIPQRLDMEESGQFVAEGTFTRLPSGNRPAVSEPARFSGFISGNSMSLTVQDKGSMALGPAYPLSYGVVPPRPKPRC